MGTNKTHYTENGVMISKAALKVGDTVTVTYNGLLPNCGADSVTMHIGYGDNWENKEFIPMEYVDGIFKASLVVDNTGSLNIAFKDSVENWDNNSGNNYVFKVTKPKAAKTENETAAKDKKTKTTKTIKTEKAADKKTSKKTTAKETKKKA